MEETEIPKTVCSLLFMRKKEFLTFADLALEYSEGVWKYFKVKRAIMNRLYP